MWMLHKILSLIFPTSCFICKKEDEALCESCLNIITKSVDTPHPFITSVYSFKDPSIRKIIHAIKYFHRKDLVRPLAKKLLEEINQSEEQIIIPIPMPSFRKHVRGYNQAEVLGVELSTITGFPIHTKILMRKDKTIRQVSTTGREERLRNAHNTFYILEKPLSVSYLLVDDVTTTGATLLEARKILLASGAKNVTAITIAH